MRRMCFILFYFEFLEYGGVDVKRVACLTLVVAFACLMVVNYVGNAAVFAEEKASQDQNCVACGEPADSRGGAVTAEVDGETLTFCSEDCVEKFGSGEGAESDEGAEQEPAEESEEQE